MENTNNTPKKDLKNVHYYVVNRLGQKCYLNETCTFSSKDVAITLCEMMNSRIGNAHRVIKSEQFALPSSLKKVKKGQPVPTFEFAIEEQIYPYERRSNR